MSVLKRIRHQKTIASAAGSKWYSERRGYGFIEVDGHEVFIHRTTLNQFGIIRIQNEDIVLITQVKTDRGFIVDTLYGVERPPARLALCHRKG